MGKVKVMTAGKKSIFEVHAHAAAGCLVVQLAPACFVRQKTITSIHTPAPALQLASCQLMQAICHCAREMWPKLAALSASGRGEGSEPAFESGSWASVGLSKPTPTLLLLRLFRRWNFQGHGSQKVIKLCVVHEAGMYDGIDSGSAEDPESGESLHPEALRQLLKLFGIQDEDPKGRKEHAATGRSREGQARLKRTGGRGSPLHGFLKNGQLLVAVRASSACELQHDLRAAGHQPQYSAMQEQDEQARIQKEKDKPQNAGPGGGL